MLSPITLARAAFDTARNDLDAARAAFSAASLDLEIAESNFTDAADELESAEIKSTRDSQPIPHAAYYGSLRDELCNAEFDAL